MTKTAEIVKTEVSLREKIALAIVTSYFQTFLDSQSKSDCLLGGRRLPEKFIKGFLHCKDIAACCEMIGVSPVELELFLYEISLGQASASATRTEWLERIEVLKQDVASLKKPADLEVGVLSLTVIKKQFAGLLGPTLRPNMKTNLEMFITDFVKEGRDLGFKADEITDFLVEIFHELGYADVAIPNPKPQFRFPLPIPNQVS